MAGGHICAARARGQIRQHQPRRIRAHEAGVRRALGRGAVGLALGIAGIAVAQHPERPAVERPAVRVGKYRPSSSVATTRKPRRHRHVHVRFGGLAVSDAARAAGAATATQRARQQRRHAHQARSVQRRRASDQNLADLLRGRVALACPTRPHRRRTPSSRCSPTRAPGLPAPSTCSPVFTRPPAPPGGEHRHAVERVDARPGRDRWRRRSACCRAACRRLP